MEDETMSQDQAFTTSNNTDDTFHFDEVKEETPTDSQSESEQEDTDSNSQENKQSEVTSEEEQRVPYSRFRSKIEELERRDSIISELEERLANLESQRAESKPLEELDVPKEWVELYGDSDVSKRAYKIQMQRETRLQEEAVQKALERFKEESYMEQASVAQNEEIINDELSILEEKIGRRISPEMEEELLAIVDEFSPVGDDGKYLSLFPFGKAYEIYQLRNLATRQKMNSARNRVADLTGNTSEGETESSESSFKRGWDNWREAL